MCSFFLFTGPELGEKAEAVEKLRQRGKKAGCVLDEYTFYAGETKIAQIVSILSNGSLFASARFIAVKNAELIKKKEDIELLKEACRPDSGGGAESVLVLISDQISVDKKLEALVPRQNRTIFWELFEERKEQWLKDFFRRNGYTLEDSAVEVILELIENNTEAMENECAPFFFCFEKGSRITADDAEKVLAHNREESPFSLFEAMADGSNERRLETALSVLQKIRLSKEGSSVQLLAGLAYCFRQLRGWHQLHISNTHPRESTLKAAGFTSKKARGRYAAAAQLWDIGQTEALAAAIARTDMDIRSSGTGMEDILLELLIYRAVFKNGAETACFESV